MTVIYEWDCETVADGDSEQHEDGEVLDHCHGESFKEVLSYSKRTPCEPGTRHELVLVRDDDNGRSWAYVENGRLPEKFTNADGVDIYVVPQKFHKEIQRV